MKASIIIPMYNAEKTIIETIESTLAQTHRDTEILVVNDSSTDKCREIALSYRPWITVIDESSVNTGHPARPRNTGALLSNGEFLLFLDADDIILPNYLESTIPLMDLRAGVVATSMKRFGVQNDLIHPGVSSVTINNMPVCALIRRKAFLDVDGYDPSITHEDWDLWLRIGKTRWETRFFREPLFHYRTSLTGLNAQRDVEADKWREQIRRRHA
jgi:glycosyltransferase involved in cell wall biosynthesis